MAVIRNPIEWVRDEVNLVGHAVGSAGHAIAGDRALRSPSRLHIRRIGLADLRDAIRRGIDDFSAYRTDVIFLCLIYPIAGLILARAASGADLLPLVFPLASGFALIGPAAAVGLYEMSRRRESGDDISAMDAFGVLRSPSFGAIAVLGFLLLAIFFIWLGVAHFIFNHTLGPNPPASTQSFLRDVFTTNAGWTMAIVGMGVGFLFALLVLAISVVSFPLLLDRDVGVGTAIWTSLRAMATNPGALAMWGLIVAMSLVIASIPLFIGLVVVVPVLGHATWHLYRKVVEH
jgi:uncharacterized membrane protein